MLLEDTIIPECSGPAKTDGAKKSVSWLSAFSFTFGSMIGTGVFITVRETFNVFGYQPIGIVLIFWILGGVIALLGGLCYTELSTRFPESGGERAYFRNILNQKISTTFTIVSVFISRPIGIAVSAKTAAQYLVKMVNYTTSYPVTENLIAFVILLFCCVVNFFSKIIANKFNILYTLLKSLAIYIIIGCGIHSLVTDGAGEWSSPFLAKGFSFKKFCECWISLFWSFEGWNTLGYIAGDMKNPRRDLPWAILGGAISVIVMNCGAVISYSAVLGFETVRTSEEVALFLAIRKLGKAYFILPILISFSGIGAANSELFIFSNVMMSSALDNEVPQIFALVQKDKRIPVFSLLCITLLSAFFLFFDIFQLIEYCAFFSWFFYLLAFSCLIKLKNKHESDKKDIFEIPVFIIYPMVFVCLFAIIMSFYLQPLGCSIMAIITAVVYSCQYIPEGKINLSKLKGYETTFIVHLQDFNYIIGNKRDVS